jgi:DNA-directed RNA polymerase subunit RPC12/RpoP
MVVEKLLKCPHCEWQGRRILEPVHKQDIWEAFTTLIGFSLKGIKCPNCGKDTTPTTKELVS